MTTLPGRYYNCLNFTDKAAKAQGSHFCCFLLGQRPSTIFLPHFTSYQTPSFLATYSIYSLSQIIGYILPFIVLRLVVSVSSTVSSWSTGTSSTHDVAEVAHPS